MKTIFVLIVVGMLSGCVTGFEVVRFEQNDTMKRGALSVPSGGIHLREETKQKALDDALARLSQGCKEPVKITGRGFEQNTPVVYYECEKAESAKTPSASP